MGEDPARDGRRGLSRGKHVPLTEAQAARLDAFREKLDAQTGLRITQTDLMRALLLVVHRNDSRILGLARSALRNVVRHPATADHERQAQLEELLADLVEHAVRGRST